jgi:purine-binding chemotaxis protein CheW
MKKAAPAEPQREFVVFRLGGVELALDVFAVREVLRPPPVVPLPKAPPFVEGVADVRGVLIPVVDLRARFEVDAAGQDGATRIMLTEVGGDRLALVVDRVTEVLRVGETSLAELPEYLQGAVSASVRSVIRLPSRVIPVLDVETLLSSEERVALHDLEAVIAELAEREAADRADDPRAVDAPASPGAVEPRRA